MTCSLHPATMDTTCVACRDAAMMLRGAVFSGWLCTRCGTMHAPFVRACECRPSTVSPDIRDFFERDPKDK